MSLKLILRHDEEDDKLHRGVVERLKLNALSAATEGRDYFGYPVTGCMWDRDAEADPGAHGLLTRTQSGEDDFTIAPTDLSALYQEIHKLRDRRIAFSCLHLWENCVSREKITERHSCAL
jgi:hypothetical protein